MSRLLQGDVGSGKTVVAAAALLAAAVNGYQGALLAPTEILAEQHYRGVSKLLAPFGLHVVLLTGNQRSKERTAARDALATGQAAVAIGTHALIQEDVGFEKLGLVIVDEQHRFGVEQRDALRQKGHHPHMLVMTATPIPRTLALTLYGDLDVSVLDEMPAGRQPIITRWRSGGQRQEAYRARRRGSGAGPPGVRHLPPGRGVGDAGSQVGDQGVRAAPDAMSSLTCGWAWCTGNCVRRRRTA